MKPLIDIDIQSEISPEDEALINGGQSKEAPTQAQPAEQKPQELEVGRDDTKAVIGDVPLSPPLASLPGKSESKLESKPQRQPGKHASLAIPAVRHLTKELNINIESIQGTGKDGRVTKEDVQKYASSQKGVDTAAPQPPAPELQVKDEIRSLTPIQAGMFKQMMRSLSIPHFLYTDNVDFTALNALRNTVNASKQKSNRLSALPFIVKAVSMSFKSHPLLNAHLDTTTNPEKPQLVVKAQHNIGIAIDSPSGLLVDRKSVV